MPEAVKGGRSIARRTIARQHKNLAASQDVMLKKQGLASRPASAGSSPKSGAAKQADASPRKVTDRRTRSLGADCRQNDSVNTCGGSLPDYSPLRKGMADWQKSCPILCM